MITRDALREVIETGAAFVPGVIAEPMLAPLLAELATMPYETSPEDVLPFTTKSELAVVRGQIRYPVLARLREDLVGWVHRDEQLREWQPDAVFVRRYHHGSIGLLPHQDGVRFRYLIATFTVLGTATFRWRNEAGMTTWDTSPGDLVLLRGTGLNGVADGRPEHSVDGPDDGTRSSVAFRMDADGTS